MLAALRQVTNAVGHVLETSDTHRLINSASGAADLSSYNILDGEGNAEERLDVIAAVVLAFVWLSENDSEEVSVSVSEWDNHRYELPTYDTSTFIGIVNDLLLGARVEWHYQEGQFVPRGNLILHSEVVKPATILLDADPKFAKASAGFQTALTRLAENKPDVAITDAASAIQEFFRALGVTGNSISDQLDNAHKASIISAADRQILKPIIGWVNADRSERGNAHHHRDGDVSRADAWLALHVAAALMVRLSNEDPRDIAAARAKRDADAARKKAEFDAAEAARTKPVAEFSWDSNNSDTPF